MNSSSLPTWGTLGRFALTVLVFACWVLVGDKMLDTFGHGSLPGTLLVMVLLLLSYVLATYLVKEIWVGVDSLLARRAEGDAGNVQVFGHRLGFLVALTGSALQSVVTHYFRDGVTTPYVLLSALLGAYIAQQSLVLWLQMRISVLQQRNEEKREELRDLLGR